MFRLESYSCKDTELAVATFSIQDREDGISISSGESSSSSSIEPGFFLVLISFIVSFIFVQVAFLRMISNLKGGACVSDGEFGLKSITPF